MVQTPHFWPRNMLKTPALLTSLRRLLIMLAFILLAFILGARMGFSQGIQGTVTDAKDRMPLIGVNVVVKGTTFGVSTDINGQYNLNKVPVGVYQIEVSYLGYEKKLYTGIKISGNQPTRLDVSLAPSALTLDQEVVVVGEKPLVDLDQSKSEQRVSQESIENAPVRQLQGVLNTQAGVVLNPEGLSIRGGRTYETAFIIDGVSATDPLAGTGFGIDLGTNSIEGIDVTTGGGDVAYGDGTSGIVKTRTRSGGDRTEFSFNHRRDRLGFTNAWQSVWGNSIYEATAGGSLKGVLPRPLRVFASFKGSFDDQYFRRPANQVTSSLYPDAVFSPYQDNRWAGMLKLDYEFKPGMRLSVNYLRSLTINQDVNMLRIIGNDVPFLPGFQFDFMLQPDRANTYTHDTNLESVNFTHTTSKKFSYTANLSRLFVRLRADANGRAWRPKNVDAEFDPASIVTFPVGYFNPADSQVFVYPGPGLYNNGGIGTLWHDHRVNEYGLRWTGNYYYNPRGDRLIFGTEVRLQDLLWIDIVRPWIGAPIPLPDGTISQSFRLGDYSDVWEVKPARGAIYASNKLKFRGLVAEFGGRLEYWFPGRFVDDAVLDPRAPIRQEFRDAYLRNTIQVFGQRMKMRLLPKISASFPIRENQVLFFNYNHSMILPHPSWVYQGLNPLYQDRSVLSRVGNPDLNPEVDISYELGVRSQLGTRDALTVSAYWKDKYDFITAASVQIKDFTGREVTRTIRINSDYARVRGMEVTYLRRIGQWFSGQASASYMAATGQSSSASEALGQILNSGNREDTRETYLAWDSPFDLKGNITFTRNLGKSTTRWKAFDRISLYVEGVWRTGRRYTPFIYQGIEPVTGRPIYERDPDPQALWSGLGESLTWVDVNLRKWWMLGKRSRLEFTCQITNLFNQKNTLIPNPVTGRAWEVGDAVPSSWRDPAYLDPRDFRSGNTPPDNPARYMPLRHVMFGAGLRF